MSKILVRYRDKNEGLMVQKRAINLFTFIPYLFSRFLMFLAGIFSGRDTTIPEWIWADFADMNCNLYSIDEELNHYAEVVDRLMLERKECVERIKLEKETIKKAKNTTSGYGKPFVIDSKRLKIIGVNPIDPGQQWKKILKAEEKKGVGRLLSRGGTDNGEKRGNRTLYTPEEYDNFKVSIDNMATEMGADSSISYKFGDQKNDKTQGENPASSKKILKHLGETEEGRKKRLRAVGEGYFDPNQWTYN